LAGSDTGASVISNIRPEGRASTAYVVGFTKILQVDGYPAIDKGDVTLAFYWAHVRRRFYELADPQQVAEEDRRRL
jgi:transposase